MCAQAEEGTAAASSLTTTATLYELNRDPTPSNMLGLQTHMTCNLATTQLTSAQETALVEPPVEHSDTYLIDLNDF